MPSVWRPRVDQRASHWGHDPADILKLIVTKGVVLAGVGIIAGVILSASTVSMMASLLYGVRPRASIVAQRDDSIGERVAAGHLGLEAHERLEISRQRF